MAQTMFTAKNNQLLGNRMFTGRENIIKGDLFTSQKQM